MTVKIELPKPHFCRKCGKAAFWDGPPYKFKLKAFLFQLLHGRPAFMRCLNCGHVATFEEWESSANVMVDSTHKSRDYII